MSTPPLTPDVEALLGDFLRAQPAVAAIVGSRVVGHTPSNTDQPWVRITQIDDEVDPSVLHLVIVHVQLDCYGSREKPAVAHAEASLLVRTVRSALAGLRGVHADGVVTNVRFGSSHRAPDQDFTPARERFITRISVAVHP